MEITVELCQRFTKKAEPILFDLPMNDNINLFRLVAQRFQSDVNDRHYYYYYFFDKYLTKQITKLLCYIFS